MKKTVRQEFGPQSTEQLQTYPLVGQTEPLLSVGCIRASTQSSSVCGFANDTLNLGS